MAWWGLALQAGAPLAGSPLPPVDTGIDAVRAILALVAVLGALAGFLWLLKRGTFAARRHRGDGLAIESALPLGERRSLVIVAVEGRRLLLGLSPSQVALISELAHAPRFEGTLGRALDAQEGRRP
jgi:flagellar biosynthetic protein FliO